jgi:DNA-binding XRE family transcriptional regulator
MTARERERWRVAILAGVNALFDALATQSDADPAPSALASVASALRSGGEVPPETYREARKMLGLTQTAMGEALGYALETVCRWEKGHAQPSAAVRLAMVAMLMGEGGR